MKNLLIILIAILISLSACKDDCLTCPENEAVINGKCQCVGIKFQNECLSKSTALSPSTLGLTNIKNPLDAFISEAIDIDPVFDFNNQILFFYLSEITKYNADTYEALCGIRTETRDVAYLSELRSPIGHPSQDTLRFYAPSAFEYKGLVSNIGEYPGIHYSTEIDDQTCYLRPYIKILDKDYIRVTFRYVTENEEVKAECVRLFHK